MSRRAPRNTLAQEVAGPVRAAFEPRYGRALGDDEVGEIADNFRRLHDVLDCWDAEDRAGLGTGGFLAANDQPTRCSDAPPDDLPPDSPLPGPPSVQAPAATSRR